MHKQARRIIYLLLFLLILCAVDETPLVAQPIPIGTWRTHASYASARSLAVAEGHVYAATANGFFYYEPSLNSLSILSTLDGFSEAIVQKLAYHEPSQTLLIVYQNGSIDLLHQNTITHINTLAASTRFPDKQINHIFLWDKQAYLSTNFGVVVINIARSEIQDTYLNIGNNGNMIAVNASAIANDTFFLATPQGLRAAPLHANLLDYRNWKTVPSPAGNPAASAIAARESILYVSFDNDNVYSYQNGRWESLNIANFTAAQHISHSGEHLIISLPARIMLVNNQNVLQELIHPLIQSPQDAQYDASGGLWIADKLHGLIRADQGSIEIIAPNGPTSPYAWQFTQAGDDIVAVPGGYNSTYAPLGRTTEFQVFTAKGWINYTPSAAEPNRRIPPLPDLVSATYNPTDQTLYIGSFGGGLFGYKPDNSFEVWNASNSPLQATTTGDVKISALATDIQGNVWMTNFGVGVSPPSLYVKRANNTWQSYTFTNPATKFPTELLIDNSSYKWLLLSPAAGGGIWVFDENSSTSRYLTTALGQGGLPSNHVQSIALDQEGQVWVGTDRGVGVFATPFSVLRNEPVDAIRPVFENRYLLNDEIIQTIAVDGGNRKWFGTQNGAWLFNAAGDELIHHFTSKNTPLPSDNILDIQVHAETGEVFFATDQGITSYRGTATTGTDIYSHVKVFPNPVKPGFDGLVGISGLVNNAVVKITDAAGRLVYETRANGGSAVWNVRDYTGRRAATGIYLIFSADAEGQETMVSKIAVIE